MIITEYRVDSAADSHSAADNSSSIAIVADMHEFEPKPVLSRLA